MFLPAGFILHYIFVNIFTWKYEKQKKTHFTTQKQLGAFYFFFLYLSRYRYIEREREETPFFFFNPVLLFDLENVFSIYSKVPQIQWMLNIFLLNKWVFEQIKEYSGWRWLAWKAVLYWFKSSHAFITFSDKFEDTVGSQPFFQFFQFAYNCQFFSQFLLSFLYWVSYLYS